MKSKGSSFVILTVVALCVIGIVGIAAAEEAEFDILSPSRATETLHWWEEILWKSDVDLTNKSIELKYTGATYVNYFKFVNVETGKESIWTAFESMSPEGAVVVVDVVADFKADNPAWGVRKDHMGDVGGATLYTVAGQTLPNLVFSPGLEGRYAIYVGMRATHFPVSIGLRIVD